MSNIYDSANELSRGLRGLPEYKDYQNTRLLKQLKMRLQQMLRQAKSLQIILPFKRKFKN